MENIITIKNLSFSYKQRLILDNINLNIPEGKIISIIGPNGCGKSTLIKCCARLYGKCKTNAAESVLIYDKALEYYERKELARTISVLPQNRNTPNISVVKLVEHGRFPYLDISRRLRKYDYDMINKALISTAMEKYADKSLPELSGGERQRAYIAMTLAQDTPIILMDEPTTYLDISHQYDLLDTIRDLNQNHNKTIILVIHDISMALKYSDQIIIMNKGKILKTGSPDEIINTDIIKNIFNVSCEKINVLNSIEYICYH